MFNTKYVLIISADIMSKRRTRARAAVGDSEPLVEEQAGGAVARPRRRQRAVAPPPPPPEAEEVFVTSLRDRES